MKTTRKFHQQCMKQSWCFLRLGVIPPYSGRVNTTNLMITVGIAAGIVIVGLLLTPLVFAGRMLPGKTLAQMPLTGVDMNDLPGVIATFEDMLDNTPVVVKLREEEKRFTMRELGVTLHRTQTLQAVHQHNKSLVWPQRQQVDPAITVDDTTARQTLHTAFATGLKLPQNAGLTLSGNHLITTPSASGEQVDTVTLAEDLRWYVANPTGQPITPVIISAAAPVQDNEVARAKQVAETLLREGLILRLQDKEFIVKPFTLRRLITFVEQQHPEQPQNTILGVELQPTELADYLKTTIAPDINRSPIDARFAIQDGTVKQFAMPQNGETLNLEVTVANINAALAEGQANAEVAVDITAPDIQDTQDIENLGITTLLAAGESDFRGSPKNRIHNIAVGTSRYHGILIPPGAEFSFLQYLGPVDGKHGFKPELVIKNNVTTPEFGGGLCQVSTTTFRAAVQSGLKIVQRRNHSYAVRYYGTPGFDATIYPPYTDLRFLNNTPAYILIQTKIEGTHLTFEFWGTDDGREITLDGPHPYNRQPDGAVKATLKQTVTSADGQELIEDTFYSNYKSPNLFPHVVAANGEKAPAVAGTTNTPNVNQATPTATPTPNPQP